MVKPCPLSSYHNCSHASASCHTLFASLPIASDSAFTQYESGESGSPEERDFGTNYCGMAAGSPCVFATFCVKNSVESRAVLPRGVHLCAVLRCC